MAKTNPRMVAWSKRKVRVRKKIKGGPERPRLTVYRSLNNIYAQLIDDEGGVTLAAASTKSASLKDSEGHKGNVAAAKKVGKAIAEAALAKGVKAVVFDRNGYLYHGRVKALAEAAREAGLEF
ncbi:50S ribosomal protein L18 [Desulfocarbo indianensis]|nr:50S ribosomal protein L18 [Desulfocarbo indianensis]